MFTPLWKSLARECRQLVSRKIYLFAMVIVPAFCVLFMVSLMHRGLPLPVPVTIVDMDRSSLSREMTRQLNASQYLDITDESEDYHEALEKVRSGESYGFFYIPHDFQKKAVNGTGPTLSLYTNMSVYVPGTMSFKGFKTVAVLTSGALVKTTMVATGISESAAASAIQPVVIQVNPLHNPWMNYPIYLNPSFLSGVLALMIMLTTAFSIGEEIKRGTSPAWLRTAGGSMLVALTGKLLPQTLIFSVMGIALEAVLFGFGHYPLGNHAMHIITAMVLFVIACQAFALIFCEILPNLRLALTLCSLMGILSFSICGFSFPVDQMYGAVGIFAYLIPLRHFFQIYIDQALNGIPIYYSRFYYISLLIYPALAFVGMRRLRKRCLNPIYIP